MKKKARLFNFFDYNSNRAFNSEQCALVSSLLAKKGFGVVIVQFDNLRRSKFDEVKKSFCLNCGSELTDKSHNIYARRFCSEECKNSYLQPREE